MSACLKCGAPAKHSAPDGDFTYDSSILRACLAREATMANRASAAEAEVERLKGVLESIDAVAVDFGYYEAAARTMKELALKALEAKP